MKIFFLFPSPNISQYLAHKNKEGQYVHKNCKTKDRYVKELFQISKKKREISFLHNIIYISLHCMHTVKISCHVQNSY